MLFSSKSALCRGLKESTTQIRETRKLSLPCGLWKRLRERVSAISERLLPSSSSLPPANALVDLCVLGPAIHRALCLTNGRYGTLLVTHGKTAAARRVLPMTPRVRKVLESRWERAEKPVEGWIWPAPTRSGHLEGSSIKKQHAKALKASSVRPFVLYSLRHTFLTRLGESGCDAWTLARIAGHSSIAAPSPTGSTR